MEDDNVLKFWGMVRANLWKALATDDGMMLISILYKTSRHEHITMAQLLGVLQTKLWKSTPLDVNGKPRGGLLSAAASNQSGVPVLGAIHCVRALLELPQSSNEIHTALRRLRRFNGYRMEVMQAIVNSQWARSTWRVDHDPFSKEHVQVDANGLGIALRQC